MTTRTRTLLALLGAFGTTLAQGQELRVRVAEPGRPTMAVGALVSLLAGDSVVTRGVTNDFGRVRLRAPAGDYVVRVERPGFADTTSRVTVPAGLDSVTITHSAQRPALPSRIVAPPAACQAGGIPEPIRPLWTAIDRTLRLVATTEEREAATLSITTFERILSSSLGRESEQFNTILAAHNRPPNARSAPSIRRAGYLGGDSAMAWGAPDVTVFSAPEFQATHCFGTVGGTANREGLFGVRFVPAATDRVEIEGTFWLDLTSGELKVIDYRFVGAPAAWRPERYGGSLEFHRSEVGFWVTRFWYQRVPRVEMTGGRERLRGYREDGAEITGVAVAIDTTDRVAAARAILEQDRAIRNRVAAMAGIVVDTLGFPLAEAEVSVMGTEFLGQSDRQGRFTLGGLPLGLQIVRVRKVGYRVQYFAIRLAGGQDWEGRVTLPKLPQTLGEIVVVGKWGKPPQYASTAKYDDFYRRRASRSGKYLTREEIDKTAAGRISELLRAIPGVRVGFVQPGESENVSFLTCPAYNVSVWIDGQKVTGQVGEILPLIAPSDIEAMEVYQRQALVPPEFRDNSCAAIVLWTR